MWYFQFVLKQITVLCGSPSRILLGHIELTLSCIFFVGEAWLGQAMSVATSQGTENV